MNGQKGFTLIEWMIYFFLIMAVLTGVFHFATSVQQNFFSLSRKSGMLSQLSVSLDAMAYDLSTSPVEVKQWEMLGPTSVVWKQDNKKIEWFLEKNILRRKEHEHSPDAKANKTKTSIVARNVSGLRFIPFFIQSHKEKKQVQSISCILECETRQIERTVVLKNREFM